jgi:hypothetical protein
MDIPFWKINVVEQFHRLFSPGAIAVEARVDELLVPSLCTTTRLNKIRTTPAA